MSADQYTIICPKLWTNWYMKIICNILSCFSHISRSKQEDSAMMLAENQRDNFFVKTEAVQVPWHCIMCDISKRPLDWFCNTLDSLEMSLQLKQQWEIIIDWQHELWLKRELLVAALVETDLPNSIGSVMILDTRELPY
jgi:hypothetical protein